MKRKRQHFVPRAYLAQFVDPSTPVGYDPYLWVYQRSGEEPFRRAPHKLAVRSYYYSFTTTDGARENAVEDLLGAIESGATPVIRTLLEGREPQTLSTDERSLLSHYIGWLDVRVPQYRDTIEQFMEQIARDITQTSASDADYYERTMRAAYAAEGLEPPADIEAVRQFALSGEYTIKADPLFSLQAMAKIAPLVTQYVFSYQWRIFEAPEGEAFFTSDTPLVRITTMSQPKWMGVGWETPWMEATLPLGPKVCLLISRHHPEGRELVTPDQVHEVNWRTAAHAAEEVYGSRPLELDSLNRPTGHTRWTPATNVLRAPTSDI